MTIGRTTRPLATAPGTPRRRDHHANIIYARAINRIRHYYTELDPAKAHYFLLSGRDDVRGALRR